MSESHAKRSRRGFMLSAAVAGTAAAAVASLPKTPAPELPAAEVQPPAPENGGGYRVSEHVKRYYRTAQV